MKTLLSIWSLASENGGPTRSTIGLAKALSATGADVVLLSHASKSVDENVISGLRKSGVVYCEGRGYDFGMALKDSREVLNSEHPDLVHIQGMWKMSTHAMNVAASEAGIPIVISPHGMLAPWALRVKRWKKLLGMILYQKGDLKRAAAYQVMCEEEASHVRKFGLTAPIIVAPIGVDVPEFVDAGGKSPTECKTALFLSRLHPGKGLLLLAEAWARLKPKGWRMLVVGPDEKGHKAQVEERLAQLGISEQWEFYGEVDDLKKWDLYRAADLFIHPSASENFCLSIAEALSSGLLVITTKGCPWSEIDGKCGWWIERNVDTLVGALSEAMSMSDAQRVAMGMIGRQLIQEKYSWLAVANKMMAGYESVLRR